MGDNSMADVPREAGSDRESPPTPDRAFGCCVRQRLWRKGALRTFRMDRERSRSRDGAEAAGVDLVGAAPVDDVAAGVDRESSPAREGEVLPVVGVAAAVDRESSPARDGTDADGGIIDGYKCKTCNQMKPRASFPKMGLHCEVCHRRWRALRDQAIHHERNTELKLLKQENFTEATKFMELCMRDPSDFPFVNEIDALMHHLGLSASQPSTALDASGSSSSSSSSRSNNLPFQEELITTLETTVVKRILDGDGNVELEEELEHQITTTRTSKRTHRR